MASFFERLRAGLTKTAQQIRERLSGGDRRGGASRRRRARHARRGPDTLEAIEDALLGADVGLSGTERILTAVKAERQGTVRERVARVVLTMLTDVPPAPAIGVRPHVILVVGVNGPARRRRSASSRTSTSRADGPSSFAPRIRFARRPSSNSRCGPSARASTWCARSRAPIRRR